MSIVRDLETYIRGRGRVSLADAARHFDTDPAALDAMVNLLAARGRVGRETVTCGAGCGNCSGCVRSEGPAGAPAAAVVILSIRHPGRRGGPAG